MHLKSYVQPYTNEWAGFWVLTATIIIRLRQNTCIAQQRWYDMSGCTSIRGSRASSLRIGLGSCKRRLPVIPEVIVVDENEHSRLGSCEM